ncbi:hypothetical protein GH714_013863 [Hevea brasiliensis]|uniref:Uncharacterized protein n=1 Tax=Hevea brasiliensis TaxID=3981 RepID=A0A6A6N888_HEVBR|nr:hypothetical protein GH714_013863 [Hevea brasiliensis]
MEEKSRLVCASNAPEANGLEENDKPIHGDVKGSRKSDWFCDFDDSEAEPLDLTAVKREGRARARVNASSTNLDRQKEELACLQICKGEVEDALRKTQHAEVELRDNLAILKTRLEEENHRQENEKVLFAIDNIDKVDTSRKTWHLGGKATDLLKSEEEKTKVQTEIKLSREKLRLVRSELEDLHKKSAKIENEMQAVQMDIQKG